MRSSFTTDDGREIDAREILDMAPTEPHSHAEYVEGCWACAWTPECTWCNRPAAEQVRLGTRHYPSGPQALYGWLCTECLRESERAKEESRRG